MRSDHFDAEFQPGAKVRWKHLTACTLDPKFAPIHFAWKQRNALISSEAPEDVTSFILHIRLDTPPTLIWTGAVKGNGDAMTYRWQTEVVTPPGFEFEITSVTTLNPGSPDKLVSVQAVYPPPVTGSPAS